jgi:hypothetical protein
MQKCVLDGVFVFSSILINFTLEPLGVTQAQNLKPIAGTGVATQATHATNQRQTTRVHIQTLGINQFIPNVHLEHFGNHHTVVTNFKNRAQTTFEVGWALEDAWRFDLM